MKKSKKAVIAESGVISETSPDTAVEEEMPDLFAVLEDLVARIESLEEKLDFVSNGVASLPAQIKNAVQSQSRQSGPQQHAQPFQRFDRNKDRGRDNRNRDWDQNRGGGSSYARGFDDDRGPRTLFTAVCAECGQSCEIPFRPTEKRPVYCKECFGARNSEKGQGGGSPGYPRRKEFSPRFDGGGGAGGRGFRRDHQKPRRNFDETKPKKKHRK